MPIRGRLLYDEWGGQEWATLIALHHHQHQAVPLFWAGLGGMLAYLGVDGRCFMLSSWSTLVVGRVFAPQGSSDFE